MIFNEILIPQDSFTKTNVTRKRVRRRKFAITFQNYFYLKFHIFVFIYFCIFENMKTIIESYDIPKWFIKNGMLEKEHQNNLYQYE